MSKTPQELFIPRVICIGGKEGKQNYPSSPFITGEILVKWGRDYWNKDKTVWINASYADTFKSNFRPIEWWEFRKPEEMPEYVITAYKNEAVGNIMLANGIVFKVEKWVTDTFIGVDGEQFLAHLEGYKPSYLYRYPEWENGRVNAVHLLPATREEYEECQKQKEG